ncbi:nibrin [Aulostomus maculatus]
MWILIPVEAGGETHYLFPNKEYMVGRKNCNIVLPNDQSISRAHAQFTVTDQTLTLKDTSKYGTSVNSQRLRENTTVNLKSGDRVIFGVFDSKFSVEHQKPIVCSSCLDNDGKASLSQALLSLGGKLVNTWSQDCTHLAMPSVKVTIKTIAALLCCRPIVKPEFFSEINRASQHKLPLPKAESFTPELDEPSLNEEAVNLRPTLVRKQLFTGLTFIFLGVKQLKRLSAAVSFGGGSSQLLEEGSLPRELLESPQSCVIDVTTGSSQPLLSSSTMNWANSVKNIVQRKGLRVITESEIGLAAIYASCDHYCNPSSVIPDSVPKVKPRIPSASLSQSVAVDETMLPATSQNITAYVANTELSQRTEQCEVTGVTAVGETPEKKQNYNASQLCRAEASAERMSSQFIVADTIRSSFSAAENKDSQRKEPASKPTGGVNNGVGAQSPLPKTTDGGKTFLQRHSPQKVSAHPSLQTQSSLTRFLPKHSPRKHTQASPQKQSTLTSFFKPVNKKRPLEDELSAVMSEPKRLALDAPDAAHGELRSRKRKEMEEEMEIHELESFMSEDMDCFDEQPPGSELRAHSSAQHKEAMTTMEASFPSKRLRLSQEEPEITNQWPQEGLEKEPSTNKNQDPKTGRHIVSVKPEQLHSSELKNINHESSKAASSTNRDRNFQPFEDDHESFIENIELLKAETTRPEEVTEAPPKPVAVKQEARETRIDEDLPKKLVLVEFRSLTVSTLPQTKPQQVQTNGYASNFKCFRKARMPGTEGSPHIIGGTDLLVHARGKNSDLDEWLKDAAEEEHKSRREEIEGDDLFRYNPTKLSKRR